MSPAQNDESRPRQGGHVSRKLLNLDGSQPTARQRQNAPAAPSGWHVVGRVTEALAGSGAPRGVAAYRCPFGDHQHVAYVALPAPADVRRRARCNGRTVTVVLTTGGTA